MVPAGTGLGWGGVGAGGGNYVDSQKEKWKVTQKIAKVAWKPESQYFTNNEEVCRKDQKGVFRSLHICYLQNQCLLVPSAFKNRMSFRRPSRMV